MSLSHCFQNGWNSIPELINSAGHASVRSRRDQRILQQVAEIRSKSEANRCQFKTVWQRFCEVYFRFHFFNFRVQRFGTRIGGYESSSRRPPSGFALAEYSPRWAERRAVGRPAITKIKSCNQIYITVGSGEQCTTLREWPAAKAKTIGRVFCAVCKSLLRRRRGLLIGFCLSRPKQR